MSQARALLSGSFAEQIRGKSGRVVPLSLLDLFDDSAGVRVRDLVKLLPQGGHRGNGIDLGRRDVFVTQKALYVGDVHAQVQQLRRNRMPEEMGIDSLADTGLFGNLTYDLANALPGIYIRYRPTAALPTSEEQLRPPSS